MCGIAGHFRFKGEIHEEDFDRLLNSMTRRGPDHTGSYFTEDRKVALGVRRLSVVDASSKGNQKTTHGTTKMTRSFIQKRTIS